MLLYIAYRILQVIMILLPIRAAYRFASYVADIHYRRSEKDRVLIMNNLKTALGMDGQKAQECTRAIMRNFAKYLVEFLRFSRMGKDYIEKNVVVEGLENLKEALKKGRGAICFSAHLGNWEWGGAILAQLGFQISVIALAHKHRLVNNFFINQRNIKGVKNIPLGGSIRKSLRLLAQNELVGILSDRDFSNNSIPVEFFGKTAFMPVGIGVLAIKARSPLVPVFVIRQDDARYRLIIGRVPEYSLTGNNKQDIEIVVKRATKTIEGYVKDHPEQWFMFDNPWTKK